MSITIYGLKIFENVINWFSNIYLTIILAIILSILTYFFVKINFGSYAEDSLHPMEHYGWNTILFTVLGVVMFWVSKYIIKVDTVLSVLVTLIFYSSIIFILTVSMIIMRRYKIKHYCIQSAYWLNVNQTIKCTGGSIVDTIRSQCINGKHKYLTMLARDIDDDLDYDERKVYNRPLINIDKYEQINIWTDENQNDNGGR